MPPTLGALTSLPTAQAKALSELGPAKAIPAPGLLESRPVGPVSIRELSTVGPNYVHLLRVMTQFHLFPWVGEVVLAHQNVQPHVLLVAGTLDNSY